MAFNKFEDWLLRRNELCVFATVSSNELNAQLSFFYAEVNPTKQGDRMTLGTFCGIRFAIKR